MSQSTTLTFTNPDGQKNSSAGIVGGQEQYPDIIAVEKSINKPLIIAKIETADSVNDTEAQQSSDYGSLGLTFYLWVPDAKVNDTIQIINAKGLRNRVDGLRRYVISNGKLQIREMWNAA